MFGIKPWRQWRYYIGDTWCVASLGEAFDELDNQVAVKIGEVDDGPIVQGTRISEKLPDKIPLAASGHLKAALSTCETAMLAPNVGREPEPPFRVDYDHHARSSLPP